ncbi:hypothetical protein K491DRAFT_69321 [Lophiostoma macrostomum CBS 122681]|uniref:Uncharacterized protein n=1 Tax=Lophiostoma macrostomum CBS 122681 TaxID=1314788 RepID=A0A6A6SYI4_9PLEO|nr:hypothetical protein K491DRAFT_69321 [Lophiostoma macrostomum CBS 122681]
MSAPRVLAGAQPISAHRGCFGTAARPESKSRNPRAAWFASTVEGEPLGRPSSGKGSVVAIASPAASKSSHTLPADLVIGSTSTSIRYLVGLAAPASAPSRPPPGPAPVHHHTRLSPPPPPSQRIPSKPPPSSTPHLIQDQLHTPQSRRDRAGQWRRGEPSQRRAPSVLAPPTSAHSLTCRWPLRRRRAAAPLHPRPAAWPRSAASRPPARPRRAPARTRAALHRVRTAHCCSVSPAVGDPRPAIRASTTGPPVHRDDIPPASRALAVPSASFSRRIAAGECWHEHGLSRLEA